MGWERRIRNRDIVIVIASLTLCLKEMFKRVSDLSCHIINHGPWKVLLWINEWTFKYGLNKNQSGFLLLHNRYDTELYEYVWSLKEKNLENIW